ncbi:MAG TPA: hypothetical protein VFO29_11900 [Candidatus Rubrimentiphilum sp.]|nr:hypothetical protein [Candidatus Rubrimentiphilum sp.]
MKNVLIPRWVTRLGALTVAFYISANLVVMAVEAKTGFIEKLWTYDQEKIAALHDPGPVRWEPPLQHIRRHR